MQVLSALRQAAFLFLISSGLTLIFGVLNILNFAHGALYMLGAYFIYALTLHLTGPAGFLIALLAAPLGVAVIAVAIETGLLRRIYRQEEIYQLLLTYSLVLIIDDLAKIVFGPEYKSIPKPDAISGAVTIFGGTVPVYTLVVLVLAPLMALVLWYLLYKTRTGKIVRATSSDREMADALGINMSALFTLVFAFGAMLAGFGGALAGPARTVFPGVGTEVIIESFVVVVIGGLGNLWGALIGSILIGTLETVGIIVFPEFEMSLIYLLMVAILVVRPWGLFGRPLKVKALSDKNLSMEAQEISPVHFSIHPSIRLVPLVLLLIVPLVAGRFYQYLLTQILIASLVAVAFNLLLGTTGLLSFGQMAFYGVGAYTVGLLAMKAGFGTLPALLLSPVFAALAAGVIGFFCVRLSGVHFAMLTLAFGQLVYTIAFKWYGFTGGDNGIQGIPIRPLPRGDRHRLHEGDVLLRPRRGGDLRGVPPADPLLALRGHPQGDPREQPAGGVPRSEREAVPVDGLRDRRRLHGACRRAVCRHGKIDHPGHHPLDQVRRSNRYRCMPWNIERVPRQTWKIQKFKCALFCIKWLLKEI